MGLRCLWAVGMARRHDAVGVWLWACGAACKAPQVTLRAWRALGTGTRPLRL